MPHENRRVRKSYMSIWYGAPMWKDRISLLEIMTSCMCDFGLMPASIIGNSSEAAIGGGPPFPIWTARRIRRKKRAKGKVGEGKNKSTVRIRSCFVPHSPQTEISYTSRKRAEKLYRIWSFSAIFTEHRWSAWAWAGKFNSIVDNFTENWKT